MNETTTVYVQPSGKASVVLFIHKPSTYNRGLYKRGVIDRNRPAFKHLVNNAFKVNPISYPEPFKNMDEYRGYLDYREYLLVLETTNMHITQQDMIEYKKYIQYDKKVLAYRNTQTRFITLIAEQAQMYSKTWVRGVYQQLPTMIGAKVEREFTVSVEIDVLNAVVNQAADERIDLTVDYATSRLVIHNGASVTRLPIYSI